MTKYLLLLLMILVNACGSDCIGPGEGINSSDTKIDIPVVINKANKADNASLWVDSGIDIESKKTIPLTVNGIINLCADTAENMRNCVNPKLCNKVIVPAIFCSDSSIPNYSNVAAVQKNDPSVMCAHAGGTFSTDGFYIDSGIKINPGDQVQFDLVPSDTIKITDCYNIPPEVTNYSFVDLEKIYLQAKGISSLSSSDRVYIQSVINNKLPVICEQGLDFVQVSGATNYIKLGPFKGNTYDVYVNNSFTPSGNKVAIHRGDFNFWHAANLADIRSIFRGNEYDYSCGKPTDRNLAKFSTYDVNYRCGNICEERPIGHCIRSLRYEWEAGDNRCKTALGDSTGLTKCKKLSIPVQKWADQLISRVGDSGISAKNDFSAVGQQCLPGNLKNTMCMVSGSLQLDKVYPVYDHVTPKSIVWMGVVDTNHNYFDNAGGYHVEVKRSCIRAEGQDLYMYIGSDPGSVAPGDAGTDHIYRKSGTPDSKGVIEANAFVVNAGGSKGNTPKSGRIYFGIKGAIDSDTVEDGFKEEPNNNKYTVSIHRVVWNPIFSDFFKLIRNSIVQVLYGTSGGVATIDIEHPGGIVSSIYNNIINNGLMQFTQAVLVLYIAFSGMSFMLGLMQRTQGELLIRVVKIGVVLVAISPSSWQFFGVMLFNLFVRGVDQLAGIFSGVVGSDDGFAFLDPTIGALLTKETWLRLLSIMFSGPIGFISFILLMWGIWTFLGAMIIAVIAYLMSIIAISLLLFLAPLFIIAILFKVTKTLFDGWIKMMLSVSLMPIILFSTLAFLHQVMMSAFYSINNFTACRGCIFDMKFNIGAIPIELCPIKALVPSTYVYNYELSDHVNQLYASDGENFFGLPFNLTAIIIFIIMAFAMKAFVQIADNMSKDIAGSMEPNLLLGARFATQGLLSLVGQDAQTKQMRREALQHGNVDPKNVEFKKRAGANAGESIDKKGVTPSDADGKDSDKGGKEALNIGGREALTSSGRDVSSPLSSIADDTLSSSMDNSQNAFSPSIGINNSQSEDNIDGGGANSLNDDIQEQARRVPDENIIEDDTKVENAEDGNIEEVISGEVDDAPEEQARSVPDENIIEDDTEVENAEDGNIEEVISDEVDDTPEEQDRSVPDENIVNDQDSTVDSSVESEDTLDDHLSEKLQKNNAEEIMGDESDADSGFGDDGSNISTISDQDSTVDSSSGEDYGRTTKTGVEGWIEDLEEQKKDTLAEHLRRKLKEQEDDNDY